MEMANRRWALGLAVLVAVLLAPLAKAEASPFQLPLSSEHEIKMKFDDRAELFQVTTPSGGTALEMRGVFNVTSMVDAGVSGLDNVPIDMTGVELTGSFYDLEWFATWDASASGGTGAFVSAPTTLLGLAGAPPAANDVMLFRPLGRNPMPGAVGRDGAVIQLYAEGDTIETPGAPILTPWDGTQAPNLWTAADTYPGASEGANILNTSFHNLEDLGVVNIGGAVMTDPAADGAVLAFQMTTGFDGLGGGSGSSLQNYLDVIGGTQAGAVISKGMPVSGSSAFADMRQLINIDEVAGGLGDLGNLDNSLWDTVSDDPLRYRATPEPASLLVWLTLAGLGSSGMAVRLRRKMRKAA